MRRLLLIPALLALLLPLHAQTVQWASKVVGFSSEFGPKQYSAKQALGKPDVLPAFKDSPCAWSPLKEDSRTDEFIHVSFEKAMPIRQVVIAESWNPGAVSRVYVYDPQNREYLVYKNDSPQAIIPDGRMMQVLLDKITPYSVKSVKVVLNTLGLAGWNHIDAIGISDSDKPVEAHINLARTLAFESRPENLGAGINTRYDEIMPIISPDGLTLFFDRKNHPENTGGAVNDDIWMSKVSTTGNWNRAENLGSPLNNNGHNFLSAISPDGNTALLGNVYEPDGTMSSGLSISARTATGWTFPKKIKIRNYYNNNQYSEFHMGTDGRTIILTIERNDSYGGKDLYVSFLMPDGIWSEPLNLGPQVNTASTEMSPFLAADGKTLYFSTGGFSGYGSKDMYISRRLDDSWTKWSEPQNLGSSINSPNWDAYYSVPASGEYAYFSSENNSIGKTDIFRIKLPPEMRPEPVVLVRGIVRNGKTNNPIQARIYYEDLETGKEVGEAISHPVTGEYTIILPAGKNYGFHATADLYVSVNENMDLRASVKYEEITRDLSLLPAQKGQTIVLNNIFFEPSEDALKPSSYPELNRVVKFMIENVTAKIEIGGHTNNSCTEDYCIQLSTSRAKAVYDYLLRKGVPVARLTYKGYGSSKPIRSNDTPEGKRANRRVDFTIMEM